MSSGKNKLILTPENIDLVFTCLKKYESDQKYQALKTIACIALFYLVSGKTRFTAMPGSGLCVPIGINPNTFRKCLDKLFECGMFIERSHVPYFYTPRSTRFLAGLLNTEYFPILEQIDYIDIDAKLKVNPSVYVKYKKKKEDSTNAKTNNKAKTKLQPPRPDTSLLSAVKIENNDDRVLYAIMNDPILQQSFGNNPIDFEKLEYNKQTDLPIGNIVGIVASINENNPNDWPKESKYLKFFNSYKESQKVEKENASNK